MHVIRENEWVRVWETAAGFYVDSKYRTYENEATVEEVIIAWQMSDLRLRDDIEAAVEFFPYHYGIRRLSAFLTVLGGENSGDRVLTQWFGPSSRLRAETAQFLTEATEFMLDQPRQLVCETPWFAAHWDGISYHFITDGKLQGQPTYADFCSEYVRARSRLHRDALTMFWGFAREA